MLGTLAVQGWSLFNFGSLEDDMKPPGTGENSV